MLERRSFARRNRRSWRLDKLDDKAFDNAAHLIQLKTAAPFLVFLLAEALDPLQVHRYPAGPQADHGAGGRRAPHQQRVHAPAALCSALRTSSHGGDSDASIVAAVTPLSSWMWSVIWFLIGTAACLVSAWSAIGRDRSGRTE